LDKHQVMTDSPVGLILQANMYTFCYVFLGKHCYGLTYGVEALQPKMSDKSLHDIREYEA